MRGPDVREVQTRLKQQGFYWGVVDGIYGQATADAVRRFQLAHDVQADGEVGATTWFLIGLPPIPTPRTNYLITIDLSTHRLYLRLSGRTVRVFPVAVGAPETPTPVGRWVIVQKALNPGGPFGARWMRLSIPWGGYGIHGTDEPESVGQAVSHGCIRMREQDLVWLYDQVPIGTLVITTGGGEWGTVLVPGEAAGPDVERVQRQLEALGYYRGPINGTYDTVTAEAVRRFQQDQGLAADGIVGPNTYDALQKAYDKLTGAVQP
jgi:L,D-transpeptidase ErfK/SrfK